MAAPASAAAASAASEPGSRSAGPASSATPENRRTKALREAPTATGKAERAQGRQVAQQEEVVLGALAEAEARIDRDRVGGDAGGGGAAGRIGEERGDVAERVRVLEIVLHRARVGPLHVHEDDRRAQARRRPEAWPGRTAPP